MNLIPVEIIENWPPNGDENWTPDLVDGALNLDDISLVKDIRDAPNLSRPVVLFVFNDEGFINCLGSTKEVLELAQLLPVKK